MFKIRSFLLGLCLTVFAISSWAHAVKKRNYWKGSTASFGFNESTGNTNTSSLNGGLNIVYTQAHWKNTANLTANYGRDKGVLNQEKFFIQDQLNYAFDKKQTNFIYVNSNNTFDKFSPFVYQINNVAGYGRKIINSKKVILSVQAGPGWLHSRARNEPIDGIHNLLSFNPSTSFTWNISKNNTYNITATAQLAKPYSYYKLNTALTNNIFKHLATSLTFQLEYYSNLPPETTKTFKLDTITSVNLVYTF